MDNKELPELLRTAARALFICSDFGLENVQADPLPKWGLKSYGENEKDGWVATQELAALLRTTATGIENEQF